MKSYPWLGVLFHKLIRLLIRGNCERRWGTRLTRVIMMKVYNCVCATVKIGVWLLGELVLVIALPLDVVLKTPAPLSAIQYLIQFPLILFVALFIQ